MKNVVLIVCRLLLLSVLGFTACRPRETATDPQAPPPASPATPDTAVATNSTTALQISSSAALQTGVDSVLKSYPDVRASNDSGVITLSGSLKKDQLQRLMTAVHALHPKKVNNNIHLK